jgi:hypothetical protein
MGFSCGVKNRHEIILKTSALAPIRLADSDAAVHCEMVLDFEYLSGTISEKILSCTVVVEAPPTLKSVFNPPQGGFFLPS